MKYWLFALHACIILIYWSSAAAQNPVAPARQNPDIPDTSNLPGLSQAAVRISRLASLPGRFYFITDPGREGLFRADPADRTTPDDSSMTLVTASGIRLKRVLDGRSISVTWFGAGGNASPDNWSAIQNAIDYILRHDQAPRTLYFPAGLYRISRPLLIARFTGTGFYQASINLEGPANAKDLSTGGAIIQPSFNNTFAIGIQLGKGVLIKDLFIRGMFHFPDRLNQIQVDTLAFNEWSDGSTRDNHVSPYAGIAIDPFSDPSAFSSENDMYPGLRKYYVAGLNRSGSTAIQITGCSITDFIVGVMLTPSNQQNDELIDVLDCDISNNKVAYAMGQAQSKECHVNRLKVWGATHTIFDNVNYGIRHGDGAAAPMVDGVNVAGFVKQLCNIFAPAFSGTFRNVYGEGLFRIGFAGGAASVSFEDCQLDFATQGPGIPYPDFYLLGSGASFHGCILRTYMGGKGYRLVLAGFTNTFEGGTMNEPPVTANVNDCGLCPTPLFRNVIMYYCGGILGSSNYGVTIAGRVPGPSNGIGIDPVYFGNTYLLIDPYGMPLAYRFTYNTGYERTIALSGTCVIHTDKNGWTGYFKLPNAADTGLLRKDDILLAPNLPYQDQFSWVNSTTYPVGFIQQIDHDTVRLRNLAYGIKEGMRLTVYADYYVMTTAPFTGDIAAGSNAINHVQGRFPAIGERPDMPMMATGTFVTAVDAVAGTIRLSTSNTSGKPFFDHTFINGYPTVEMHSCFNLPALAQHHKSLIGGSVFYLHELANPKVYEPNYLLAGSIIAQYRNLNTLIGGDSTWHSLRYEPITSSLPPVYQSPNKGNN